MDWFELLVFQEKHVEARRGSHEIDEMMTPTPKWARLRLPNGYEISVIAGWGAYGGGEGLYELAILDADGLTYETPITDDVEGWLTPEELSQVIQKVADLPRAERPTPKGAYDA
jgi:hypothetical protein